MSNSSSPSVAVIIPTWNRARTIETAINSVLAQTLSVEEVFVCDDGSTDETREIVMRMSCYDSRIKWVPGERAGRPAVPRNRGLREVRTEWVAFLDSDDCWLPEKLERQIKIMSEAALGASCSNADRVVEGVNVGPLLSLVSDRVRLTDLIHVNSVVCSSVIVRTSLIRSCGGFPEIRHLRALEDYALWMRVSTMTDFAYCSEPLVLYTDDPVNSVRAEDPDVWTQRKYVFSSCLNWLRSTRTSASERRSNIFLVATALREAKRRRFQFLVAQYRERVRRVMLRWFV